MTVAGPRGWLNEQHGRLSTWLTQRRVHASRTLLVADHWDGSVQQFYHFLLGYLLPASQWINRNPDCAITLRDCGPMQPWIDAIAGRVDVETISPGFALHAIVGNRMAHKVLRGMDDPYRFRRRRLVESSQDLRRLLGLSEWNSLNGTTITVIDRASSEDFYSGTGSETHMSGSKRRSIPNLSSLRHYVDGALIVDFARLSPTDQIARAESTRILVGQHGAGLTHMLWMQPGSCVIEIAPPLPPEVENLFQRLATVLGHQYLRIQQQTVHSPIDIDELASTINRVSDVTAAD